MCYFRAPSVVNEPPHVTARVTCPQTLWPRGFPPCTVSQGVHRSPSCLLVPCGAFEIKAGCIRVARPGDTELFITPELFLLVCKPSSPPWELPEAVENPETPAEGGWGWPELAWDFAGGPLSRVRKRCQKELDAWPGILGVCQTCLVEEMMMMIVVMLQIKQIVLALHSHADRKNMQLKLCKTILKINAIRLFCDL